MRVYPAASSSEGQSTQPSVPARREQQSNGHVAEQRRHEDAQRTAIVSLFGEDLSSEDAIEEARPERDENAA